MILCLVVYFNNLNPFQCLWWPYLPDQFQKFYQTSKRWTHLNESQFHFVDWRVLTSECKVITIKHFFPPLLPPLITLLPWHNELPLLQDVFDINRQAHFSVLEMPTSNIRPKNFSVSKLAHYPGLLNPDSALSTTDPTSDYLPIGTDES